MVREDSKHSGSRDLVTYGGLSIFNLEQVQRSLRHIYLDKSASLRKYNQSRVAHRGAEQPDSEIQALDCDRVVVPLQQDGSLPARMPLVR